MGIVSLSPQGESSQEEAAPKEQMHRKGGEGVCQTWGLA